MTVVSAGSIESGVLVAIVTDEDGSALAADVPAGSLVLPMMSVMEFNDDEDGGSCRLWSPDRETAYDYGYTVDEETDRLLLDRPLEAAAFEGDAVADLTAMGNTSSNLVAKVDLAGDGDPVDAVITTAPAAFTVPGDAMAGTGVDVRHTPADSAWEYEFVGLSKDEGSLDLTEFQTPTIAAYLPDNSAGIAPAAGTVLAPITGWMVQSEVDMFPPGHGATPGTPTDGAIRIQRDGYWTVTMVLDWVPAAGGGRQGAIQRVNWDDSISTLRTISAAPAEGGACTVTHSETFRFNEGAWVRLAAQQSSGGSLALRGSTAATRTAFKVEWKAAM